MFLQLAHTKLSVYQSSQDVILECYKLTKRFPPEERFSLVSQIRRAAISVHLNLAEGSSRKSGKERIRFYEIARGSLIEVDSAVEVAHKIGYLQLNEVAILGEAIIKTFKLLSGMINQTNAQLTPDH